MRQSLGTSWQLCCYKQGVILIDHFEKGKTIIGTYYANLLDHLKVVLKEKRPMLAHKKMLFHLDNAASQKLAEAKRKLNELSFELVPNPLYLRT